MRAGLGLGQSPPWRDVTVGDVVTFQRGFDITKGEQSEGQYPVISSSGLTSTHSAYKVKAPGVVIGRKGSLGGVYFSDTNFWPHDTTLWVKDFHGNDPRFIYYWLQTLGLRHYDVGASNPTLNRNHLHLLPSRVPDLSAQRKIVSLLAAYDDLLEINNRRIGLLEEIVQRIYREWFVDFRYPLYEGAPAIDSPLGPIPEGWRVGVLDDLLQDVRESIAPGSLTDSRPYVPIDCITTKSVALVDWRPGSEAASSLLTFQRGDLLFGAMRPYFHKVAIAPWIGTTRATCLVLRPRRPIEFSYCAMTVFDETTIEYATAHASGTTIPYARWAGSLAAKPTLIPNPEVTRRFDGVVRPVLDWLTDAGGIVVNLARTRDFLLPRLISGEIATDNLDIPVGETAA